MFEQSDRLKLIQEIALQSVCAQLGITPVSFEELNNISNGIEQGGYWLFTSSWSVVERAPKYETINHAIGNLSVIAARAYNLALSHQITVDTTISTESIIDIRYDLSDGQGYRIRIYSPVTNKQKILPGDSPEIAFSQAYHQQFHSDQMSLPMTGKGYLISIKKESKQNTQLGSDETFDETATFLVVSKDPNNPTNSDMSINQLQDLVNAIMLGISSNTQLEMAVTDVTCKFRTGLNLSERGTDPYTDGRYVYIACDHGHIRLNTEELLSRLTSNHSPVDLRRILLEMMSNQYTGEFQHSPQGEIEINKKSPLVRVLGNSNDEDESAMDVMSQIYT